MVISSHDIQSIHNYFKSKRRVNYVVLFGSALKALKADSDIDLLIGGTVSFNDRISYAADLEKLIGRRVDIVPIDKTFCDLALQAFAHGKIVFVRRKEQLKEDYYKSRRLFDDNTPLRQIRTHRIRSIFVHGQT